MNIGYFEFFFFGYVKCDEHPVYVLLSLNSAPFLSSCKHMFPLQLMV